MGDPSGAAGGRRHASTAAGALWWKAEHDIDSVLIDVEDMKRICGVATEEQWQEIDFALSHVRETRAARAFALSRNQAAPNERNVADLRHTMEQVEEAIKKLAELSGDRYPPKWFIRESEASRQPGGWHYSPP